MDGNLWEDRLEDEPEFPELEQEPFEAEPDTLSADTQGLINLGYLTEEFQLGGNDIVVRTPYIGEELEIGLVTKKYKGTDSEGQAYMVALVAASLERVNGRPVVQQLGPSDKDYLQRKFDYVQSNYFLPVIQEIYREGVIPLLKRQAAAIEELRSKSTAVRPTSSPSSESQTERDSSKAT
jgi:hypothetical protein